MGIVDNAVYVDGRRTSEPASLSETYEACRAVNGMAWIGLYRPTEAEMQSVAAEFSVHGLAVEDTLHAHQRPKLERYGDQLFTVLRPARYVDDREEVEFGEIHIFIGSDFVVTVRHAESPDLAKVRRRLEGNPELLRLGPEAVLYAIFDEVVDQYAPVVAGLQNDIDEIETQVFEGDPKVSRRAYELSREVIDFQRATSPLIAMLEALGKGFEKYDVDEDLRHQLRDVQDHLIKVDDQVGHFRELLNQILIVNSTLVAQRQAEETQKLTAASFAQGEQVKRISSWAAILFAPSIVTGIYGMNFRHMPELFWRAGYAYALVLMLATMGTLYLVFKRKGWI